MDRMQVPEDRSRQVRSFRYDQATQVLEIEFSSGGVYDYAAVPESVYQEFIKAESLGSFIANRIRGAFEYTRLHIFDCIQQQITKAACPSGCLCWCHKVRKDVSHGETIPNPSKEAASKSVQKGKAAQAGRQVKTKP